MKVRGSHRTGLTLSISLLLAAAVFLPLLLVGRFGNGPTITYAAHYTAVPTVGFSSSSSQAAESVVSPTISLELSGLATGHDVTVAYNITGGTASSGDDFSLSSPGTVTISSGSTTASISFTVVNDAGEANGVFEFWVDDTLEAASYDLNWVGSYSGYGINAVYLENFWNAGSPQDQERYFDDIVISTQRIGC